MPLLHNVMEAMSPKDDGKVRVRVPVEEQFRTIIEQCYNGILR